MSAQKLLYVFDAAPYSDSAGQEALDAVLIGAAFEQEVSVLFIHDGVFQLKSNQNTQATDIKQYTKTYRALEDFGVKDIFVHDLSLLARGIEEHELIVEAQLLNSEGVADLIAEQYRVFTF